MKAKTTSNASDALRKAPAYPLTEAARYLRLAPATLRSWCVCRPYQRTDGTAHFRPLIQLPGRDSTVLSFENLIEAHVLRALRIEHSVSITDVREAILFAEKSLHIERLLTSRELRTHAGELFLERYGQRISLSLSGQLAMRKLLEAHLKRVEWDLSGAPCCSATGSPRARSLIVSTPGSRQRTWRRTTKSSRSAWRRPSSSNARRELDVQ
jgi:hypothetical protein